MMLTETKLSAPSKAHHHIHSLVFSNCVGKNGWLTNGFCIPFQNALGPVCCTETENKGWSAVSGGP